MKKKAPAKFSLFDSLTRSYWPVVFWPDDLDNVVARLKTEKLKVTIETKDFEFDSIDEFTRQYRDAIQSYLKISTPYPSNISLELEPTSAKLSVTRNYEGSSGLFFDLDNLVKSRQRKLPWLYSVLLFYILLGIRWIPDFWLPPNFHEWYSYASGPIVIWVAWACYIRIVRHSVIHTQPKTVARSFLRRNRDQLAVAVIASVIGAILGVTATKIADKISSTSVDSKQHEK